MLRRRNRPAWGRAACQRRIVVPDVQSPGTLLPVSVCVSTHNYGRYLRECLDSILAQAGVTIEVVVVDDASTDDTPAILANYIPRGVGCISIEAHQVTVARRVALQATSHPLVLFVDADNILPPGYIAAAAKIMTDDHTVGIVACDLAYFGDSDRFVAHSANYSPASFRRHNCLDTGSMVRRQALVQADAPVDCSNTVASDWIMFRRVLDTFPWEVAANPIPIRYRKHDSNMLTGRLDRLTHSKRRHYDDAGLGLLPVTIFTTYSARVAKNPYIWHKRWDWLSKQTWPLSQTRLVIANTSHKPLPFERMGLEGLGFSAVSVYDQPVGRPGLEDEYRRAHTVEAEVQTACASIYNRMLTEVRTDWCLILEDDVFPDRIDLIERLMSSVDANTYAVSACYRQRYTAGWSTCDRDKIAANPHLHQERGNGVQIVGITGFGCLLISLQQIHDTVFTANEPPSRYFDNAFFSRMLTNSPTLVAKVDWSMFAEHLGAL